MRRFDYSFLRNMMLPMNFLNLTNIIYALRNEASHKKMEYPDIFTNLEKIAIIQSVKSSNEIEGIVTTNNRIKAMFNNNSAPLNHNEEEILGYRDALNIIHNNHDNINFDIEAILNLHKIMLNHTDYQNKGEFKKQDNIIREKYNDGTIRTRFIPISANDTEEAMQKLVDAYMDARNDSSINQLLLIPCVILDFLCIHPFADGNGRISRLLSLLLMYKNNFDVSKYISFEEKINENKYEYYEALKASSMNWIDGTNDYIPFMQHFIYMLFLCYRELDKRFLTVKDGKVAKNKRVESVILTSFIPISKQDISNMLPDISISTIEKVLSDLLKDDRIIKIGNTNNAKYFRKK